MPVIDTRRTEAALALRSPKKMLNLFFEVALDALGRALILFAHQSTVPIEPYKSPTRTTFHSLSMTDLFNNNWLMVRMHLQSWRPWYCSTTLSQDSAQASHRVIYVLVIIIGNVTNLLIVANRCQSDTSSKCGRRYPESYPRQMQAACGKTGPRWNAKIQSVYPHVSVAWSENWICCSRTLGFEWGMKSST